MANTLTHSAIAKKAIEHRKKILKEQNLKEKEISEEHFISGSVFPDIYEILSPKKKSKVKNKLTNTTLYWHENIGFGKRFGERLLKKAKTKEDRSFALGFVSHFILDDYVHGYFRKNNMNNKNSIYNSIDHLIIEYFINIDYINHKIPHIKSKHIPKELIQEVFKELKANPKYGQQIKEITAIKLFLFNLQSDALKLLTKKRYKKQSNSKISLLDGIGFLVKTFFSKKIKLHLEKNNIHGFDINEILHPNHNNPKLQEHILKIKTLISRAEIDFQKLVK